ncbi:DUF2207 domain-containing protein [Hyphococcus sp.]|uniref:DUF2207 domain-containing protein n=1 Tax=Hyphococcus sp. TaxID=2038636 RepID=UPI0035C7638E
MTMRVLLIALAALLWPALAQAAEQIENFDVEIGVRKNGDITVTEKIQVTSEGRQIRRGIFRDLPRYYEKGGVDLPYSYKVKSVERDGRKEPYAIERVGNAYRIRIGDADVYLDSGVYEYEIEYEVKNQIRYFDGYDEVYWNATGNYWNFPILKARAVVRLPGGAGAVSTAGYTGSLGAAERNYQYAYENGAHVFTTTEPLALREGLTVAVGFEKGVVDPPSASDRFAEWLRRNASSIILAIALSLLTAFYLYTYDRVGRDPAKGPVFPRYAPPDDLSPAAVHHIYHRRFSGHRALIATLMSLAVKDRIKIDAEDKKKTTLTRITKSHSELAPEEAALLDRIFNPRKSFTLGDGYDSAFTHAYNGLKREVGKDFGKPFFKWNTGFLIFGVWLTIGAVVLASIMSLGWTGWQAAAVVALIILSVVFSYFLPAPTERGQRVRTEIEGFRLYLKTAEKLQLNAVKVGSDAPPPMTVERYERFLPYAVALGVEEPWTRHFEKLIPEEAASYQPRWATMHRRGYRSLNGLNSALVSSMSSGVSSALPQSSSSSGSSGGGFSGGGGGGGGGGGW